MARNRASHPLYASWDACVPHTALWLQLGGLGMLRRCAQGATLYRQHEPCASFYLIRSGFVQTDMIRSDGSRLMLELMGHGTLFGEGAAFDGLPRYVNTQCLTDVVLSVYVPADIAAAGEHSLALFETLVKIMSAKQRALASKLLQFSAGNPETRLRQLLARIVSVQQRVQDMPVADRQLVRYGQEQLAEMCGTSRISVTRALKRLAGAGLVRTHVRHVEVLDAAALEASI